MLINIEIVYLFVKVVNLSDKQENYITATFNSEIYGCDKGVYFCYFNWDSFIVSTLVSTN